MKENNMNEILERIAKSLESIDAELKARNKDRETLINQAEQIEKTCLEIKEDPFGLNVLKEFVRHQNKKSLSLLKKGNAYGQPIQITS